MLLLKQFECLMMLIDDDYVYMCVGAQTMSFAHNRIRLNLLTISADFIRVTRYTGVGANYATHAHLPGKSRQQGLMPRVNRPTLFNPA